MRESRPDLFIAQGTEKFVAEIKDIYGEQLLMVGLYGSAATGNFVSGISDINMLIIIAQPDSEKLFALSRAAARTIKDYRITPHILSKKELLSSSDIFPVEYLELIDSMKLLDGENLLTEMQIGKQNVRHQIETMARGGMNSLRQLILAVGNDKKRLQRGILEWSGRQLPLFRAVLRYMGASAQEYQAENPLTVISHTAAKCGISCEAIIACMKLREGGAPVEDITRTTAGMVQEYAKLVEVIDGFASE